MKKILLGLLLISLAFTNANSASSDYINGYNFSLSDIERKCEIYKYSDNYGELDCSDSKFKVIEKKCEVYFSGTNEGEFECRGRDLKIIERKCTATMYSDSYAEIEC